MLDQKAIISATAVLLREQRDENRKLAAELLITIESLEQRNAALEQRGVMKPARRQRRMIQCSKTAFGHGPPNRGDLRVAISRHVVGIRYDNFIIPP